MVQEIVKDNIKKINTTPGLYLHIPFCQGKCRYCDFYSINYEKELMTDYINALTEEIEFYSNIIEDNKNFNGNNILNTIYIGGGTPGLLKGKEAEKILMLIYDRFSKPVTGEITLEANPCSINERKLADYRRAGINRLSLGVQSFNDRELIFLGRKHDSRQAVKSIQLVKKYFDNFNIDLIFAIPGQKLNKWRETLEQALDFDPAHISLYNLQIEEGTPLAVSLQKGDIQEFDNELDATMYLEALKILKKAGYTHYEISNFARKGYQSLHNRLYWEFRPYLGLGPAAHSFTGKLRYHNHANLNYYLSKNAITGVNSLNQKERMAEMIFMGLRLLEGIPLKRFQKEFSLNLTTIYSSEIKKLKSLGLIKLENERVLLTEKGLLHGNRVFMEFLR